MNISANAMMLCFFWFNYGSCSSLHGASTAYCKRTLNIVLCSSVSSAVFAYVEAEEAHEGTVVVHGHRRRLSSVLTLTGDELLDIVLEEPIAVDPVTDSDAGTETCCYSDDGYCL